jgi:hypothetical protein
MQIDRRITNGLAWAGVLIVVGVPTADLLSAQFAGPSAMPVREQVAVIEPAPIPAPLAQRPAAPVAKPAVAAVAPVKPAPVAKPAAVPAATTADVVDNFLQSGKPLPSYITGAEAPAAPRQAAAAPAVRTPIVTTPVTEPAAPAVDPVQVASIGPQRVAPVPMPLSMRPRIAVAPQVIVPADVIRPPANVTASDLADWESGPLSEFLASRQRQGQPVAIDPEYDPDGFFLDEGPNSRRGDRVVGWQEQSLLPFFID